MFSDSWVDLVELDLGHLDWKVFLVTRYPRLRFLIEDQNQNLEEEIEEEIKEEDQEDREIEVEILETIEIIEGLGIILLKDLDAQVPCLLRKEDIEEDLVIKQETENLVQGNKVEYKIEDLQIH